MKKQKMSAVEFVKFIEARLPPGCHEWDRSARQKFLPQQDSCLDIQFCDSPASHLCGPSLAIDLDTATVKFTTSSSWRNIVESYAYFSLAMKVLELGASIQHLLDNVSVVHEKEECLTCFGHGHFDADGNPTSDRRCRKCADCDGTGELEVLPMGW